MKFLSEDVNRTPPDVSQHPAICLPISLLGSKDLAKRGTLQCIPTHQWMLSPEIPEGFVIKNKTAIFGAVCRVH